MINLKRIGLLALTVAIILSLNLGIAKADPCQYEDPYLDGWACDRKSTRLNSSHER